MHRRKFLGLFGAGAVVVAIPWQPVVLPAVAEAEALFYGAGLNDATAFIQKLADRAALVKIPKGTYRLDGTVFLNFDDTVFCGNDSTFFGTGENTLLSFQGNAPTIMDVTLSGPGLAIEVAA